MEAVKTKEVRTYICQVDRDQPVEKQTKFILGVLNAEEEAYLRDSYSGESKSGSEAYRALNIGLEEVINLTENGVEVKVERDPRKGRLPGGKYLWGDSILKIDRNARDEIALEIFKSTLLSEEALKNL